MKVYKKENVFQAAQKRISDTFDSVEKIYIAFSGGKDSSVMFHLVMMEAVKRNRKVAVTFIDFKAVYADAIRHAHERFEMYKKHIARTFFCVPMPIR